MERVSLLQFAHASRSSLAASVGELNIGDMSDWTCGLARQYPQANIEHPRGWTWLVGMASLEVASRARGDWLRLFRWSDGVMFQVLKRVVG